MRIHLKITKNTEPVPFDHQHLLTGKLHKWFGENDFHDDISLYSFSNLNNARMKKKAGQAFLDFPDGTNFFISSWKDEHMRLLIDSIQKNPEFLYGMHVEEIIIQETPDFENQSRFLAASPIFVKRNIEDQSRFFTYKDEIVAEYLKETLEHKMEVAGIEKDPSLSIHFDKEYHNPKTKLITYKNIKNRCSVCPIIIEGNSLTKAFAWNVGVGNSTGIGFGALK